MPNNHREQAVEAIAMAIADLTGPPFWDDLDDEDKREAKDDADWFILRLTDPSGQPWVVVLDSDQDPPLFPCHDIAQATKKVMLADRFRRIVLP